MSRAYRHGRQTSVGIALVLALCAAPAGAASLFDPALRFRTLTTEHFTIYFHQGEDVLAAHLAELAETVWARLATALHVAAPRRTHVVLADQSELANGWATPLPRNTIFVTAAAPSGSEYIARTDDWLRFVFTHELAHILHLDRSEGWARVFRGIFGRTAIAFPNLWLPAWQIEGLATWQESALTGSGRLHAGDFRAIEREAARERRIPSLDRVNGGLTDWPGGLAPYAFGLGFHEYLAERFGEDRFGELASATSRRLPFFGSTAFPGVYGASLGTLWADYTKELKNRRMELAEPVVATRLTRQGHVMLGPRFLPAACKACSTEIVYTARNPHGFPALRSVNTDGSASKQLATRYLGSTVGVARELLVFDQQELTRNVGLYSDLYLFDRQHGSVHALTRGQRLQDPDLSPDATMIACVREDRGRRDLMLVRLSRPDRRDGSPLNGLVLEDIVTLMSEPRTQFNAPRWSPDGTTLAVERHAPGRLPEIVLVDVRTRGAHVVAADAGTRFVTPTWRPDGRALVAAGETGDGAFSLYELSLETPSTRPRRLTTIPGGALWPDVSPDGRSIAFAGYTADGFDVFVMPYPHAQTPSHEEAVATEPSRRPEPATARRIEPPVAAAPRSAPYSPWPTLPPTSWFPILETSADQARVGLSTSGYDVLARHAYSAAATWLISGPDATMRSRGIPDFSVAYAYDRWQPTLFVSGARTTYFAAGAPDANGRPTAGTLHETEIEAGILLPLRHVRRSQRVLASVVRTGARFTSATEVLERTRTALRAGAAASSTHVYGYSISPEDGVTGGTTVEFVPPAGDFADTTKLTADLRAFVPGIRGHHVVALRAAGGASLGDERMGRTFLLGGAGPNTSILDFGRDALSLLRAFPSQSFAGTRAAVVNVEYRWPIARPQRGVGVWPLLIHTVHGAAVADAGHVWSSRFRAGDVKTSIGMELSLNVLLGYSFPLTLTVGAAWGRDGAERQDARAAYVRIGRSF
jgi:Tol biopolymer transport system component